jgi:hypothetical protein
MRLCGHIVNHTSALLRQPRQRLGVYSAFLKSFLLKDPPEDWSIRRLVTQAPRSRTARFASVTDQSDHSPDPKADFPRYPPNADAP